MPRCSPEPSCFDSAAAFPTRSAKHSQVLGRRQRPREVLHDGVETWAIRRIGSQFSEPLEVTAVSRIRGTKRIQEITRGHEQDLDRVQEEPCGHRRTREDLASRRFGTVRPRVQIPGPRPDFEFRSVRWGFMQGAPGRPRVTAVSQILENSAAAARLRVVRNPRLNSRIVAVQPIYQHAQGPGPCVTRVRKSNPAELH